VTPSHMHAALLCCIVYRLRNSGGWQGTEIYRTKTGIQGEPKLRFWLFYVDKCFSLSHVYVVLVGVTVGKLRQLLRCVHLLIEAMFRI